MKIHSCEGKTRTWRGVLIAALPLAAAVLCGAAPAA
jgi:hypothetical protein